MPPKAPRQPGIVVVNVGRAAPPTPHLSLRTMHIFSLSPLRIFRYVSAGSSQCMGGFLMAFDHAV